jgi:hypothetical protein
MTADPLGEVLRLVAEGRLSPEEAAPILAALEETSTQPGASTTSDGHAATSPAGDPHAPTTLRIEVREQGRQVVNIRLPIAVGRFALDRVPGLSGEQVDRVREAMRTGFRGAVLVVDDEGAGGVGILLVSPAALWRAHASSTLPPASTTWSVSGRDPGGSPSMKNRIAPVIGFGALMARVAMDVPSPSTTRVSAASARSVPPVIHTTRFSKLTPGAARSDAAGLQAAPALGRIRSSTQ